MSKPNELEAVARMFLAQAYDLPTRTDAQTRDVAHWMDLARCRAHGPNRVRYLVMALEAARGESK